MAPKRPWMLVDTRMSVRILNFSAITVAQMREGPLLLCKPEGGEKLIIHLIGIRL